MENHMDIVREAMKYWQRGDNCARSSASGILDYYQFYDASSILNLSFQELGGGIGEGSVCGAVLGSLAAISYILSKKQFNRLEIKEIHQKFKKRILEEFGTIYCKDLMSDFTDEEGNVVYSKPGRKEKCTSIVEFAAETTKALVDEAINSKK